MAPIESKEGSHPSRQQLKGTEVGLVTTAMPPFTAMPSKHDQMLRAGAEKGT